MVSSARKAAVRQLAKVIEKSFFKQDESSWMPEESEFDKDVNKTDPAIPDTAALPHADRQSLTSDDGVSSSTLPAAGGNSPTRDEQNKKRVQDSIHILTGIFEKLTLEIPKMERGLRDLSECYETLKRELDELKKTE
uniref:Uncharacterized protein n=1 Tax=Magallana gigas TaxID=29159 RepID=A0A8W8J9T0_MAGGI